MKQDVLKHGRTISGSASGAERHLHLRIDGSNFAVNHAPSHIAPSHIAPSQYIKKKRKGNQAMCRYEQKAAEINIIKYNSDMDIRNLEQLPKGVGAKYLEVITSHIPGVYIAAQWRRKLSNIPVSRIIIEL